jgi:hypothetical protein
MRTTLALLVVVAVAVVSPGCGASTPRPDTKAQYEQHLGPAARSLTGVLGTLQKLAATSIVFPAKPTAARDARAVVERTQATLREAAQELDDVTPPPAVGRDHARLGRATRKLADELGPVIEQLKRGSLVSAAKLPGLPAASQVHATLTAIAAKGYRLGSTPSNR